MKVTEKKFPWGFIGLSGLALLFQWQSTWRPYLVYDRAALAHGQWWRLWTGHLVHFGWSHLAADVGLFLLLGFLLGRSQTKRFYAAFLFLPLFISSVLFFADPAMLRYGGLSAVNLSLVLFLAGQGWQNQWKDWFPPAIILLYLGELIFEAKTGQGHGGGLIRFDDPQIHVATSAHVIAAVGAVLILAVGLCGTEKIAVQVEAPAPGDSSRLIKASSCRAREIAKLKDCP